MVAFSPILGIRIAQLVLSIIVLGIDAYVISKVGSYSSPNFIIFCCVWTWLVLAYTFLAPRFLPRFHDKWAILGVEIVTVIFWFSAWVALAAYVGSGLDGCDTSICGTIKAVIAFGCFEWLSWVASLVLVCLSIFRGRNDLAAMPLGATGQHHPVGGETAYTGGYGNDGTSASQMGFNPSETPGPHSTSTTPAPYDPYHSGNTTLQPDYTGVSSVSGVSQQQSYGAPIAGGYGGGQQQAGPYDPHYSQHDNYNVAEMPVATGYGGQDRGQQQR